MPLVNMTGEILDMEGKSFNGTVKGPDGHLIDSGVPDPVLLRKVCREVLLGTLPGDGEVTGLVKADWWALAERLRREENPSLSAEEITLLKTRIGRNYNALIVGQAFALLDPKGTTE